MSDRLSDHLSDVSDDTPLMDNHRHSPGPNSHHAPSSSSSSSLPWSRSFRHYVLLFLALCVVGYLAIVYFGLSPPSSIQRGLFWLGESSSCQQHFHGDVDDPFTLDERIDLDFFRSLKVAIQQGDDDLAASIARELSRSYAAKSGQPPQAQQTLPLDRRPSRHPPMPKRRGPPSAEQLRAVQALIEQETAAVLNNRTLMEWDMYYRREHRTHGSYLMRYQHHMGEGYVLSAEGCEPLGQQCSVSGGPDGVDKEKNATALCNKITACLGFTCNHERNDCQLRVAQLVHDRVRLNFDSYYKNALALASADVFVLTRRKHETSLLAPGSIAAADFDFTAPCSETFKCVITYGLYGRSPKYGQGALENVKLCPTVFPGWTVRIYHDDTVPDATLQGLIKAGAELVRVDTRGMEGSIAGMFWRFLVADDDSVQRYMVRDSDSRLNPREAAAVAEWIASGYSVHSMRDHPYHDRPLNGGMWGGVRGAIPNIRVMILNSGRNGYGADLVFLNDKVWPLVKYDQISHDSYSCERYVNARPFPSKRPEDYQHVGQVYEDNKPRTGDITCCLQNNPAPEQCRKDPSWLYG